MVAPQGIAHLPSVEDPRKGEWALRRWHLATLCLRKSARQHGLITVTIFLLLCPILLFHYTPTQDGPSHLANALIIRDIMLDDSALSSFYYISTLPLPNWTCSALLVVLSTIVPPLCAEKVLVALYVVGFLYSYRYFLNAVNADASFVVVAGVVTLNRCFWLGFYNYCLSMALFFVVVGFVIRYPRPSGKHTIIMGLLFIATYFTHLFGFILSLLCSLIAVQCRRGHGGGAVVLSSLPAIVLSAYFLWSADYGGEAGAGQLTQYLFNWVVGTNQADKLANDTKNIIKELLPLQGPDWRANASGAVLIVIGCVVLYGCVSPRRPDAPLNPALVLGVFTLILYFALPDVLTFGKGGFWKARLAPVWALLLLASVSNEAVRARYFLGVLATALLVLELSQTYDFVASANNDLEEFCSGSRTVGTDRVIFSFIAKDKPTAMAIDPYRHASDYYCLGTHNINVCPHFASLNHSTVRLRPGRQESPVNFADFNDKGIVDVVIIWEDGYHSRFTPGDEFRLSFRNKSLRVFEKLKR